MQCHARTRAGHNSKPFLPICRSPNGRGLAPIGDRQHQICLVRPFLSRKAIFFWVLWAPYQSTSDSSRNPSVYAQKADFRDFFCFSGPRTQLLTCYRPSYLPAKTSNRADTVIITDFSTGNSPFRFSCKGSLLCGSAGRHAQSHASTRAGSPWSVLS